MSYCWRISFKVLEVLFLRKFPKLFCLQRRHVGYTNLGTFEFANSIPAFLETGFLHLCGSVRKLIVAVNAVHVVFGTSSGVCFGLAL